MNKILLKVFCLLLVFASVFALSACNKANTTTEEEVRTFVEGNMKFVVINRLEAGEVAETYAKVTEYVGESAVGITIPSETSDGTKVKAVGGLAFYNKDISIITVSEGIISIDNFAFGYCGFSEISLPSTITKIGDYAFVNCISLKKVIINATVLPSLGAYAFKNFVEGSEQDDPYEIWAELEIYVPSIATYTAQDEKSNWYEYKNNLKLNEVR